MWMSPAAAPCYQGFLPTQLVPFPARLCGPGLLPVGRARCRQTHQRTHLLVSAAAAAAAAAGMAADALSSLRDFRLTLPEGADPATPLVVRQAAEGGSDEAAAAALACGSVRLGRQRLQDTPNTLPRSPLAILPSPACPQVVLGWYGCQDKHLSKYSSLLEKQGYPSLRGILPGHAVFSPFAFPRRRWAARLLDAIAAVDPQGRRPVVLYAFSNGEEEGSISTLRKDRRCAGVGAWLIAVVWAPPEQADQLGRACRALPASNRHPRCAPPHRRRFCGGANRPAGAGRAAVPPLCVPHLWPGV